MNSAASDNAISVNQTVNASYRPPFHGRLTRCGRRIRPIPGHGVRFYQGRLLRPLDLPRPLPLSTAPHKLVVSRKVDRSRRVGKCGLVGGGRGGDGDGDKQDADRHRIGSRRAGRAGTSGSFARRRTPDRYPGEDDPGLGSRRFDLGGGSDGRAAPADRPEVGATLRAHTIAGLGGRRAKWAAAHFSPRRSPLIW